MRYDYNLLHELNPLAGLRVLTEIEEQAAELAKSELLLKCLDGGKFRFAFRDRYGRDGVTDHRKRMKAFNALKEVVERNVGHGGIRPDKEKLDPAELLSFERSLAWLLLESGEYGKRSSPEEGHYLVVVSDIPEAEVAKIFGQLNWHPTQLKVAACTEAHRTVYFFHVRHDENRLSSFADLVASGRLARTAILAPFNARGFTVFLPADQSPAASALKDFGALCHSVPGLFGLAVGGEIRKNLMAIVPQPAERGSLSAADAFLLHNLEFVHKTRVWPRGLRELEIHRLTDTDGAIAGLRQQIARLDPEPGYRLELRRLPRSHSHEIELERIEEQRRILYERRDYLRSFVDPPWRLLRFTQRQLRTMAEVLCRFAIPDVKEGEVRYGFQAAHDQTDPAQAAGIHYLLFDPSQAPLATPFLDLAWQESGEPRSSFWLDPYWDYTYRKGATSLVFVPEDYALFPVLNSWDEENDEENMDRYLAQSVRDWFEGDLRLQKLPKRPIYLFDEHPDPDMDVKLVILDQDGFNFVKEKLGWISSNLALLQPIPDAEDLILEISNALSCRKLAEKAKAEAKRATQEFETAAKETREAVEETLAGLLDILTREISETSERIRMSTQQITKYHRQLDVLMAAIGTLHSQWTMANDLLDKDKALAGDFEKWKRIAHGINQQLNGARQLIADTDNEVRIKLKELEESLRELHEMSNAVDNR